MEQLCVQAEPPARTVELLNQMLDEL
jgi:hypothetical protein